MKIQNDSQSNKKIIRKSLIGLLISLIVFPILVIIGYTSTSGRIIGFIFYFLLTTFCVYEFANVLPLPKWSKYYFSLISFLFFFFSITDIQTWILNGNQDGIINNFIRNQYLFEIGVPGIGYLVLLGLLFIPFLFTKITKQIVLIYLFLFVACLMIGTAGKNLFYLNTGNFWFMIVIYTSVIATDTFAYFGGRLLGNKLFNKKLAPRISPNKTIEGAIIGYVMGFVIIFLALAIKLDFNSSLPISWYVKDIIIPMTFPLVAISGDLLFSGVKRFVHIKDFALILPEHGGLLDRLDAIIVVSFFYLMIFI